MCRQRLDRFQWNNFFIIEQKCEIIFENSQIQLALFFLTQSLRCIELVEMVLRPLLRKPGIQKKS